MSAYITIRRQADPAYHPMVAPYVVNLLSSHQLFAYKMLLISIAVEPLNKSAITTGNCSKSLDLSKKR